MRCRLGESDDGATSALGRLLERDREGGEVFDEIVVAHPERAVAFLFLFFKDARERKVVTRLLLWSAFENVSVLTLFESRESGLGRESRVDAQSSHRFEERESSNASFLGFSSTLCSIRGLSRSKYIRRRRSAFTLLKEKNNEGTLSRKEKRLL